MRDILFRAKTSYNGEWVYGYYCHCVQALNCGKTKPAIQQTDDGSLFFREVIPETAGQYTGLTDKNGKKIFEGDIVRYEDAEADFEGYHDSVFMNCGSVLLTPWGGIVFTNRQTVEMDDLYDSEASIDAEVIGNVHDNPELLGGTNNE